MFVYKKLKPSDANKNPFEAHKHYTVVNETTGSLGISFFNTSFTSASIHLFENENDLLNHKKYFQLNHLFYDNYLHNYGNLIGDFDYINQEKRLYDKLNVLSIPQDLFGNSIEKGTIRLLNKFKDDKKGNLTLISDDVGNYPKDKERVFYLGPVKGFKKLDLSRDPKTGFKLVDIPLTYDDIVSDDSLFSNGVEYISSSISGIPELNCTGVNLKSGFLRIPHSNNFNFGENEDFTITFYYKSPSNEELFHDSNSEDKKYLFSKSFSKTVVVSPESNPGTGTPLNTSATGSLGPREISEEPSFPFEIFISSGSTSTPEGFPSMSILNFSRADQNTITTISSASAFEENELAHYSFIKSGSELQIWKNGSKITSGSDLTFNTKNKANLYIGNRGGTRSKFSSAGGTISQMMIFNRALQSSEIINVSESITGTPFVGNAFYKNGFITITSPKHTENTLASSFATSSIVTLEPTFGTADNHDLAVTTEGAADYTNELTFFNTENVIAQNSASFSSSLNLFGRTTISETNTHFFLQTPPSIILGTTTVFPISSSELFVNSPGAGLLQNIDTTNPSTFPQPANNDTIISQPANLNVGGPVISAEYATYTQKVTIVASTGSNTIMSASFSSSDNAEFLGTSTPGANLRHSRFNLGSNNIEDSDTTFGGDTIGARTPRINTENPELNWLRIIGTASDGTNYIGGQSGSLEEFSLPIDNFTSASFTTEGISLTFGGADVGGADFSNQSGIRIDEGSNTTVEFFVSAAISASNIASNAKVTLTLGLTTAEDGHNLANMQFQPSAIIGSSQIEFPFNDDDADEIRFITGTFEVSSVGVNDRFYIGIQRNDRLDATIVKGQRAKFEIVRQDPDLFNNRLVLQSDKIPVSQSKLYKVELNHIDPSQSFNYTIAGDKPGTTTTDDLIPITFDQQGNRLGLQVALISNIANPLGPPEFGTPTRTLLTSALYFSESLGNGVDNNSFSFTTLASQFENLPTDDDGDNFMELVVYPASASGQRIASKTQVSAGFALGSGSREDGAIFDFIVTEISGSNVLTLQTEEALSSSGIPHPNAPGRFNNPDYNPVIIFNGGAPVGILQDTNVSPVSASIISQSNGLDNNIIEVAYLDSNDTTTFGPLQYLITGSIGATASFQGPAFVSASMSFDVTEKGLYTFESLHLNEAGFNPVGTITLGDEELIRTKVFVDGVLTTSSFIEGNKDKNLFAGDNEINFGILSSSQNISLVFDITSGSSEGSQIVTDRTGSFVIGGNNSSTTPKNLQIRKVSSSNILTRLSGDTFDSDINLAIFTASFGSTSGSPALPFTSGTVSQSVTFIDSNTIQIDGTNGLFLTSSIELEQQVGGPFFTSASLGYVAKAGAINKIIISASFTSSDSFDFPSTGIEGIHLSVRDFEGNQITGSLIDNSGSFADFTFTSSVDGSGSIHIQNGTGVVLSVGGDNLVSYNAVTAPRGHEIKIQKVIGAAHDSLPLQFVNEITSGSFTSNEATDDTDATSLTISSSHPTLDGQGFFIDQSERLVLGESPIPVYNARVFDTGSFTLNIEGYTSTDQVILASPLFITASSPATGTLDITEFFLETNTVSSSNGFNSSMENGSFNFPFIEDIFINDATDPNFTLDQPLTITSSINVGVNYISSSFEDFNLQFKNTHLIFEHEYLCTVEEDEYNFTLNPSVRKLKDISTSDLANFATGSKFKPYATTIGLYNEEGELLVVGKLGQPIKMSDETDTTFVVRFDT